MALTIRQLCVRLLASSREQFLLLLTPCRLVPQDQQPNGTLVRQDQGSRTSTGASFIWFTPPSHLRWDTLAPGTHRQRDGSTKWETFGDPTDNIHSPTIGTNYRFLLDDQQANGPCGPNSYTMLDAVNSQHTCACPAHYSFIDEQRVDKGCKPDFQPQSCDLDDRAATMQFQFTSMHNVDWPKADYEMYTFTSKDQCQQLCLADCFCAVAVFRDVNDTCWKKKMPLSNGVMGDTVQRTVFIKVPKNSRSESELVHSAKWEKDKKYWILGSSLFLVCSVLANLLLIYVLFGMYSVIKQRKEVPSLQQPSSNIIGMPLKTFTYAELEYATGGFQEVLGTGASGVVYKGQLQDETGTPIAVKKMDKLEQETDH